MSVKNLFLIILLKNKEMSKEMFKNNLCHFGLCKKPKKAVAIINIKITVPIVQTNVLGALYDP